MSLDIHGKKIHLEEYNGSTTESANHAAKYLEGLSTEQAHEIFGNAVTHGSSHFRVDKVEGSISDKLLHHDMTLEHRHGEYYLRKKSD